MNIAKWALVAGVANGLTIGICNAAPFSDGSFETPGNGGITTFNYTNIGPWVHGGNPTALDFYSFTGDYGQVAQNGSYFVGFGGLGTVGGTLSQTFDTTAGQSYQVTYYTAKQQDGSPADAALFDVSVVNAADSASLAAVSGSVLGTLWVQQSFSFTATGPSSTLTFEDDGGVNNSAYNLSLDNFSINSGVSKGSPVPEPASIVLLGLGILGLAGSQRRRAQPIC